MKDELRGLGKRLSNWGRWGADDERGTVNFITPAKLRQAAACIRRGAIFSLALPFGAEGPQFGQAGRVNPMHLMTSTNSPMSADPDGPRYADDFIMMPLQCATQWDSLAHVHYGGQLYNGQDRPPFAAGVDSGVTHPGVISGLQSRGLDCQVGNRWTLADVTGQLRTSLDCAYAAAELAQQAVATHDFRQTLLAGSGRLVHDRFGHGIARRRRQGERPAAVAAEARRRPGQGLHRPRGQEARPGARPAEVPRPQARQGCRNGWVADRAAHHRDAGG